MVCGTAGDVVPAQTFTLEPDSPVCLYLCIVSSGLIAGSHTTCRTTQCHDFDSPQEVYYVQEELFVAFCRKCGGAVWSDGLDVGLYFSYVGENSRSDTGTSSSLQGSHSVSTLRNSQVSR